jgi:hypothetical protein
MSSARRFPALLNRRITGLLYRQRRCRPEAGFYLFRGGAPAEIGGRNAHQRRGAADRGEYRQAAGVVRQVLTAKNKPERPRAARP